MAIHRFLKHMLDLRRLFVPQSCRVTELRSGPAGWPQNIPLAESAMSHVVNERMGKRQPMRWSAEGALLLQVRCAVLDNPTIGSKCSSASGCRISDDKLLLHC